MKNQQTVADTSTRKGGVLIYDLPPVGSSANELVLRTLIGATLSPSIVTEYMSKHNIATFNEAVDLLVKSVIDATNQTNLDNGVVSVVIDEVEYWDCIHCKQRFSDMFEAIECCAKIKHLEENLGTTN